MNNKNADRGKNKEISKDNQAANAQIAAVPHVPTTLPEVSAPQEPINIPTPSLPTEKIPTLQIQDLQSSMASSISTIAKNYGMLQGSFSNVYKSSKSISSVLSKPPDYTSMLQGMRPALQQVIESIREATKNIDLGALAESMRPLALEARRIKILDRTNWPIYLVDNKLLRDALDSLPKNMTEEDMREQVTNIACEHLGAEWLAEVKERWREHSEITTGEMRLLNSALERHEKGDYEGCVSLLMGLLEGLLCKYAPVMKELDDEQTELFDTKAKAHGLAPSHKKNGKLRKLANPKDLVLILVLLSENGWYAFQHASGYIADVTLTNTMDEDLAAHNPLRNKICHGVQTEFGTQEHSLKAILVTDLVIRFGAAVSAGQNAENTPTANSKE